MAQQGEVSDNKITLLAKKIGTTQVSVLNTEGRSRGSFEIEVTPTFQLQFNPEKAIVEVGKTTSVSIVGVWNATDRVQIANGDIVAQQGEVSDNKITLLAKKIGTTQVSVLNAEGRSRGSFEITTYSNPISLTLSHYSNIPLYELDKDLNTYKQLIEKTIQEYDKLKKVIDKLEKYPINRYNYSGQNNTWENGVDIYKGKKQEYENGKNGSITLEKLRNLYEDMYTYGVVYAHIELMARIAENLRKKYPTNVEIEDLIRATFDGLYATQEGHPFIKSTNDDIVSNYNKIIDIANRLAQK